MTQLRRSCKKHRSSQIACPQTFWVYPSLAKRPQCGKIVQCQSTIFNADWHLSLGTKKCLSIAKNHPKPSQEFSERLGPFIHKMEGFSRNSLQKVHPNFAQTWEDKFLGIPFLASISGTLQSYGQAVWFKSPKIRGGGTCVNMEPFVLLAFFSPTL